MISRCLESGDGLGDLNLMKQPSNTQTFVLHWDGNVKSKEDDKITKYAPLEAKIQESFHVQTESIPIIVGALGTIPSRLLGFLKPLVFPMHSAPRRPYFGKNQNLEINSLGS